MSRLTSSLFCFSLILAAPPAVSAQEKVTWQDHIRPIFENRCNNCHNADKKKGDLDLSTFAGIMAGGSGGSSVEAGDSAASTLWKVVTHSVEPFMPPKGDKIPQAEADLIAKWIAGGVLESADSKAKVKKKASFAMSATASTARPEGPPPVPEHVLLEPVVTSARPNTPVALAHSPWAPVAAVAAPRQVLLYHSGTGELLGVLPFPDNGTPETLSFSRNGALILAGGGVPGKEGAVVVWDVKSGQQVIHLKMTEDFDTVLAADITADLSKVAMGGPGRRVRIYDTRNSQLLANIKKHTDWVTSLAFSPDGVLLATGDRNGGLYIWEAGSGNEFHTLRGHEKMIASLAWRGDSNLLAAGSEDGNITWWEMANGTQVKKIGSHGGVLALGFAPDGRLVSGGRDGHVRIWDGNGAQQKDWVPAGGSPVLETAFADDGKRVLTGTWNGEIKAWDPDAKEAAPLALPGNPPSIADRLAALSMRAAESKAAVSQATAVLSEKEKAAAAQQKILETSRETLTELQKRQDAASARRESAESGIPALAEKEKNLRLELEKTQKELEAAAAAAIAVPVPPEPAPEPVSTESAPAVIPPPPAGGAADARPLLEKTIAEHQLALTETTKALDLLRTDATTAGAEEIKLKQDRETLASNLQGMEQAAAAAKQEMEAAKAALEAATAAEKQQAAEIARWEAARQLTVALRLRDEARAAKELLESMEAPADPSGEPGASGATEPQDPETIRLREAATAEAAAKQQAAEAAWAEYLKLLPQAQTASS